MQNERDAQTHTALASRSTGSRAQGSAAEMLESVSTILDTIRKNALHASLKAVDASGECPHDTPPSLSHLEAPRALLGLAAAHGGPRHQLTQY